MMAPETANKSPDGVAVAATARAQHGSGVPAALTIAGSDSSGGAGIQADLKTFAALDVYGASVLTALTAQNTCGVSAIHVPPAEFVAEQIAQVLDDIDISGTKIGMLAQAEVIEAVHASLSGREGEGVRKWKPGPIILDPVMVATTGAPLIDDAAVDVLVSKLFPIAELVTPNLLEAARLLGQEPATSLDEMRRQAEAILGMGPAAVLMKGGHFPFVPGRTNRQTGQETTADFAVDLLVSAAGVTSFALPRIATRHTHGTGCTLSSAIAALRAHGLDLPVAVAHAKGFVGASIRSASDSVAGRGDGPLDHIAGARWWRGLATGGGSGNLALGMTGPGMPTIAHH